MSPFHFSARLHFSELTGLSAANLEELLAGIKNVPDSSIYHHTHRFLQQHLSANPEPPNDFSYWVSRILGDEELGEILASVDIMQFTALAQLREAIVAVIENYLKDNPRQRQRFSGRGKEFYFLKAVSFIIPAGYVANDLSEFAEILKKVSVDSLYFHMFEARLRLGRPANDFSCWVEETGNKRLAQAIAGLDPYACTIDDLRRGLVKLVEKNVRKG